MNVKVIEETIVPFKEVSRAELDLIVNELHQNLCPSVCQSAEEWVNLLVYDGDLIIVPSPVVEADGEEKDNKEEEEGGGVVALPRHHHNHPHYCRYYLNPYFSEGSEELND